MSTDAGLENREFQKSADGDIEQVINTSMVPLSKKSTIDISFKMASPMPSPLTGTLKDSPNTSPLPPLDPPIESPIDEQIENAPTNETGPTTNSTSSIPAPQTPNNASFQNIPNQTTPVYSNPNTMMQYPPQAPMQNPQLNMQAVYPQMNMFQMMGMMPQQQHQKQNVPCRYFVQGKCWHGEHCRFSHDLGKQTQPQTQPQSQPQPQTQPQPQPQSLHCVEVPSQKKEGGKEESKDDENADGKPTTGTRKLNKSATEFRPAAENNLTFSGEQQQSNNITFNPEHDQFQPQNQMFAANPFFPMMPSPMFVEPVHPSFYANPLAYMGTMNQQQQTENVGQGRFQQNDFSNARNFSNRGNRREKRRFKGNKNHKKRENWSGKDSFERSGNNRMNRRQREFREQYRENVGQQQQRENEPNANQSTIPETGEKGKGSLAKHRETLNEANAERKNTENVNILKREGPERAGALALKEQKGNNANIGSNSAPHAEKKSVPADPNKPKSFSQIVRSQNLHAPMSLNVKPMKLNPLSSPLKLNPFQNSSSLTFKKKNVSPLETGQSVNTNKQTVQLSNQSITNQNVSKVKTEELLNKEKLSARTQLTNQDELLTRATLPESSKTVGNELSTSTSPQKSTSLPSASKQQLSRPRPHQASKPLGSPQQAQVGTSNNQFQPGPQTRPSQSRNPQSRTVPHPNPNRGPSQNAVQRPSKPVKPSTKWPFIQPSASKITVCAKKEDKSQKEEKTDEEDTNSENLENEMIKSENSLEKEEKSQSAAGSCDSKDPTEKEEQKIEKKSDSVMSWAAQAKEQQVWVRPPPVWSNEPPKPKPQPKIYKQNNQKQPPKENKNSTLQNRSFSKKVGKQSRRVHKTARKERKGKKELKQEEEPSYDSGFSWEYWDALKSTYYFQDVDEKVIGICCSFLFDTSKI